MNQCGMEDVVTLIMVDMDMDMAMEELVLDLH